MKEVETSLMRHRVAFALIATLLLFILVVLPFALASVVEDVLGPPEGRIFSLASAEAPAPAHSRLHVAIAGLDEFQQLVTLRVTGHHVCPAGCTSSDQVVFFAVGRQEIEAEGLPPSATVKLPSTVEAVNQTIQLPVRGQPTRYPFDDYELWLGAVLQRVLPDGTVQTPTPAEVAGHLFLSFQEQLPRHTLGPLVAIDPQRVRVPHSPYNYLSVTALTIGRPLYLRVLAVLLVLLIAAAASYAVFMRPLNELVVNSGALILGVWGIRGILINQNYPGITAVDLSLSVVILFLLSAITVRALLFFDQRSGLRVLARKRHK